MLKVLVYAGLTHKLLCLIRNSFLKCERTMCHNLCLCHVYEECEQEKCNAPVGPMQRCTGNFYI